MEDKPEDLFGQVISIDDFVIGGQRNELAIYKVMRITPKMVRIVNIHAETKSAKKGKLRYAGELLKIEEHLVTFYLMKCR